ncbi:PREDICTED: uncharacterized protein LOC107071854 [Polistes dominula]|uniref:Uncharacterized protein LOC107071854 n=1 Tax=Polistes dominula TaxID=743375 RepID=A0ABM1J2N0_POLDO|nr:PREDICTED: uncharacterized protein LOC107071854 [Polistes dominula]
MRVESLLIQFVTIFLYILKTKAEGIMCYRCVATFSGHDASEKLCSQFNGNKTFQVSCPTSTFCVKKTVYYKSQTSMIKTVQRDCATQKYIYKSYDFEKKEWSDKEEVIKTVYEEGCATGEDRGATGRPPEYCYCDSDLCNFSPSIKTVNVTTVFLLALSLLFVKFVYV